MSRIEPLNTLFFPIPALRVDGKIIPAPEEALTEYYKLKNDWLKNHPNYPNEIPSVSLYPGSQDGKDGYFVRSEIMYK